MEKKIEKILLTVLIAKKLIVDARGGPEGSTLQKLIVVVVVHGVLL